MESRCGHKHQCRLKFLCWSAHCFMPIVVESILRLTRYSETGRWYGDGTYFVPKWKVKRAVVRPQFEFRAAVRRHLACYRRALASRWTITAQYYLYWCPASRARFVIPFLPSTLCHGCTVLFPGDRPGAALRDPVWVQSFFCASFAQNLVSIPSRKRRRSPIIEWRAAKAA